jgi:FkbM family methyltransferase
MIRLLYKYVHRLLRALGYQLVPASSFLQSQDVVELIISKGGIVKNIYDIGAHKGEWTLAISRYLNNDTKITMFEPSASHQGILNEISNRYGYRFIQMALGKSSGFFSFYTSGGTGDSFYEEVESENKQGIPTKLIEVETLDNVIERFTLQPPDLLKLDCQGSELDILKGGKETLGKVSSIILEASILECNIGAPLMGEVVSFLELHGFYPISLSEVHNRTGILKQIDLVFLNRNLLYK